MSTRRRQERGAAALETVGLMPILILSALIVLQIGVAGWTVSATGQAARDAARAASLGQDAGSAAKASLPGSLTAASVAVSRPTDGRRVTVAVEVPSFVGFDLGEVSRTAEMPAVH